VRIAIDASRITVARRTGTENYALNLIRALLAHHAESGSPHRIILYFRDVPRPDLLPHYTNVEHRVIPARRAWTHTRFAAALFADGPDVTFVPAHTLPFIAPGKMVVTVHDLGYRFFPEAHRTYERIYLDLTTRFSAWRATRILADSKATSRDLSGQYGTQRDKISVVYPGVEGISRATDDEIAAARAKYGLPDRYFLFFGTLQPRKNITTIRAAHHTYMQNGGDIPFVFAGKRGWMIEEVVLRTTEGARYFPGYIADEHVAAVYSGATALIFPSLYEGFGFPVITSNTSSLVEVAGDAAITVDPFQASAITAGMQRLAADAELRESLIRHGYELAAKFTWRAAAEQTMTILESAALESAAS
jgi:glycosyltransferase involved in cell wall biosynthesis